LRKLAELTQGTLQIDRLLHLILTCVTAGTGLGFNRALLFLVDYESKIIYGKMAVGPSSMEEANVIWNEIKEKYESLEDLIKASENNYQYDSPLHMLTRLMAYSLENEKEIIVDCVKKKKTICERNGSENYHNDKDFAQRIGANEFVCVPLLAREKVLGVICADNLYSKRPITEEQMSLLTTFANHAALAIENADAYKKLEEKIAQLKDAQERLIRSDRMAVMGNMASYIAHEIRNPLVTIGGFARSIARDSDENNKIKKNADIILEEVSRLEKILEVIMGFSKSEKPVKVETQINEILNNTIILMNSYLKSSKISIKKDIDSMLPEIVADPDQIKQVFLNILKNAVESMKHGGELTIETTKENEGIRIIIADTGEGMKAEIMDKIFSPFFTTKNYGTGIGLAVTQRIIDEHEGSIHVKSKVNEGTTFTIYLPVKKD